MSNISVTLDCEHELWFKKQNAPEPGEKLWCSRCGEYKTAGPVLDSQRGTYYPDSEWTAYKVGKTVRGVCINCGHEARNVLFKVVRTNMERHWLRGCKNQLAYDMIETENPFNLPKNSPPPF